MIEATPNIGPESYFEQRPPDRLIGFETEYDARTSSGQEDSHAVAQMLHKSNFEQIGLRTTGTSTRKWVENGSFVHIDVGHVESAAAESAGAREATIAQHSTATTLGKLAADTPHLRI